MGQPARSEEDLLTNLIKSSTEMAPGGSHLCRSPRRNLSIDLVEDELTRDPGSIRGPYSDSTSPALSHDPTPGPELVPALIPALVPAPTPPFSDKLFKQFMRAYLESNQEPK